MNNAAAAYLAIRSTAIRLAWRLSRARDVSQYEIWVSHRSGGPYALAAVTLPDATEVQIPAPPGRYYVRLRARDCAGNCSLFQEQPLEVT